MALLSSCVHCGAPVCHPAHEVPQCDRCSGRIAAREAETARWQALTVEQKLDELKARLDGVEQQSIWDGRIG